ncbi:unnamed protein product [Mytilus coruscus]|uniref:Uncharacterized protein n=1 Tax=Mytilus coruscus TaxID=42192 RepID=A0A6J8DQ48_MYTCO|nr:unnamed protein product [Mytilus coruscus]
MAGRYRNDDRKIEVKDENRSKDRKETKPRNEHKDIEEMKRELKDSLRRDCRNSNTRGGGRRGDEDPLTIDILGLKLEVHQINVASIIKFCNGMEAVDNESSGLDVSELSGLHFENSGSRRVWSKSCKNILNYTRRTREVEEPGQNHLKLLIWSTKKEVCDTNSIRINRLRWPVAFFGSNTATAHQLHSTYWKCVDVFDEHGFTVDYMIADGASTNIAFTSMLFSSDMREQKFKFFDLFDMNHSMCAIPDIMHVLKRIRNNIESSKLENNTKQGRYLYF